MSVRSLIITVIAACVSCAQTVQANICDAAAFRAANETAVPAEVLLTITRLETGRSHEDGAPWPWTVNHGGNGTWFASEDQARSYVFSRVKRGESNMDIGCFQINYHWHADAFRSLDDMFNPDTNARYAAHFLEQLYSEFGNWTDAAGAYHSRTPEFANRYKTKFQEYRARVAGLEPAVVRSAPFPTRTGSPGSAGSLFRRPTGPVTPFIDFGKSR